MVTKELLDYINYQLDHGEVWSEIKKDLAASGWDISALDEAYSQIMSKKNEASNAQTPSPMIEVAPSAEAIAASPESAKIDAPEQRDLISNAKASNTPLFGIKKEPVAVAGGISVPGLPKKDETKPKNKFIVPVIIVAVLVLLIAGGVFAFNYNFSSDAIAAKILSSYKNINSGEFSGNLSLDVTPTEKMVQELGLPNTSQQKVEINLDGKFNYHDESNAKADMNVKLASKSDNKDYQADLALKIIDNALFFKLNQLTVPSELEQNVAAVKTVGLSKWVKADISKYAEKNISTLIKESREKNASPEVKELFSKALNFKFIGFENVDSTLCSKIKVSINKDKSRELLLEFAKTENTSITQEEIDSFNKEYNDAFDQVAKNIDINIYVGVFDSLVHKSSFSANIATDEMSGTISASFNSKKENTDIQIASAEESIDFESFYQQILSIQAASSQNRDNEIKSAMSQIQALAANYRALKQTFIGFNTSIDGEKIIKDSINSWGGNAAVVLTSKDKFCMSKDLIDSIGTYWCADSNTFFGSGTCDKDKIACVATEASTPTTPANPTTPTAPTTTPVTPTAPVVEKSETEKLVDALASALQSHNTSKGTYLGYISSADGIKDVKKINETGGDVLVVATSKVKFCLMKKLTTNAYYCVDSTGYSGDANGCTSKTISCK